MTITALSNLLQILEQVAKLGVSSLERPAGYRMIRFGVYLNDVILQEKNRRVKFNFLFTYRLRIFIILKTSKIEDQWPIF